MFERAVERLEPVSPEVVERSLQDILRSEALAGSPLLCRFLRFVVSRTLAGAAAELKENVIGVGVFGRSPDYDPKIDPVVRVHARRLREKLGQYYEIHGDDPVRIDIPKGGYVPVFVARNGLVPSQPAQISNAAARGAVAAPPGPRRRLLVYGGAAVLLLGIAGWSVARELVNRQPGSAGVAAYSRPFTTFEGYEQQPAFSPDGKLIAYCWNGPAGGPEDIYIQSADSDTPVQLTHGPGGKRAPVFSPDGTEVAYLRTTGDGRFGIFSMKLTGGTERKRGEGRGVMAGAGPYPQFDWSPDGKFFAVVEDVLPGMPWSIVLIASDTGTARPLTSCPKNFSGDSNPVFSPDGATVAFRRGTAVAVEDLYLVSASGGEPRRLTHDSRATFGHAWTPDGKRLVVSSSRAGSYPSLWMIPVGGGLPERLTDAGVNAQSPAIPRRGHSLGYVSVFADVNVWRMPSDGSRASERLLASTMRDTSPQYSPDGETIAFRSNRSGYDEIWLSGRNGERQKRLTNFAGPLTGSPRWSPDGRSIALDSRPAGNADIFIVGRDGGVPRQLTVDRSNEVVPSWSADGRFVYFASDRTGSWQVWKRGVAGDAAVQVTRQGGFAGFESADGRYFYYAKSSAAPGIWRVPSQGGIEEPVLASLPAGMWGNWALVGDRIFYLDSSERASLEIFNLVQRKNYRIAPMERKPAVGDAGLTVSPDGRWVAYSQVDLQGSDIILVDPFR